MTALSIQPTFPIFTDIDGQPLEAGYIFIGVANLAPIGNPINVYWDAALTLPAAQPIRTLGGYPMNSGTPARLYVNSDYSIQVQNKNGSLIYSALAATERYNDVVVSVNAEVVIYDPPFANAVQTNVEGKLAQTVSVKDFGAVGDGVTNDTAAIQAAIDSGSLEIRFPEGNYNLGTLNTNGTVFNIQNVNGLRFLANGLVTFSFTWAANATQPVVFAFTNCSSVRFDGNFAFVDSVSYDGLGIKGTKAIRFNDNNTNFTFENISFSNSLTGIEVVGTIDSRSVKNISANIIANNLYYGLNCQQNGDSVRANIYATNCRREYFVYGVRDHRIKLTIVNKNVNNSSILNSYEYNNQTEDIDIDITAFWPGSPQKQLLALQHLPNSPTGVTAGIRNIRIKYQIYAASPNPSSSFGAIELTAFINGGPDITTNVNCITTDVFIDGNTNGYMVYDIYGRYAPLSGNPKGNAFWPVTAKPNFDALQILHHTKTYSWTPVITGVGWSLGNGTAEGNYTLLNDSDSMFVWGKFTFGSTSTFGAAIAPDIELPLIPYRWAGEGSFSTGHPSTLTMVGSASLWDSSAGNSGYYQVPVKTNGATGTIYLTLHGTNGVGNSGYVNGVTPFTWGSGDVLEFFAHIIHNNTDQTSP
jgi:hypothetical protein